MFICFYKHKNMKRNEREQQTIQKYSLNYELVLVQHFYNLM